MVAFFWARYNGSYIMAAKVIKFLELHYTRIQFFNNLENTLNVSKSGKQQLP